MTVIDDELRDTLEAELSGWKKIVVLGIGNELRSDDGLGLRAAKRLKTVLAGITGVEVLATGTSPENFTGLLRRLAPSHILLLDALESGDRPGTIKFVKSHQIEEVMPSTHTLPLYVLAKYLEQQLGSKVLLLGIQPNILASGTELSDEVKDSVGRLVRLLRQIIIAPPEERPVRETTASMAKC